MKKLLVNSLIVLFSVLSTYIILEIGYRFMQYRDLNNQEPPTFWFWSVDRPIYQFDEQLGYQYIPDQDFRLILTDHQNYAVHASDIHVNNAGHISDEDDNLAKENGEYRIALIGDSFTSSHYNPTPWGDILQDQLNQDEELLALLGATHFNVINFGLDGIGVVQFDDVYQHTVQAYQPDLVLVNFVSDDLYRRFLWRDMLEFSYEERDYLGMLSCSDMDIRLTNPACNFGIVFVIEPQFLQEPQALYNLRHDTYQLDIERRPWLGIYPELLASIASKNLNLVPHLEQGRVENAKYTNLNEAVYKSRIAIDNILNAHPNVLLIHIPFHTELETGEYDPILELWLEENADLSIIMMRDYLPEYSAEESNWFNLPFDNHFNENGAELFAQAIMQVLHEHTTEFSQ